GILLVGATLVANALRAQARSHGLNRCSRSRSSETGGRNAPSTKWHRGSTRVEPCRAREGLAAKSNEEVTAMGGGRGTFVAKAFGSRPGPSGRPWSGERSRILPCTAHFSVIVPTRPGQTCPP